jgi:hypothetical protein
MFPLVVHTYALSLPEQERGQAAGAVKAAVEEVRARHPLDFNRWYLGMEFLSSVFFCNHAEMPLVDYIESLYCVVKHAQFTRSWREQLRAKKDALAVQ